MIATHLLYKTIYPDWIPHGNGNCFFCGCPAEIKWKPGDLFVSYHEVSGGDRICDACYFAISETDTTKIMRDKFNGIRTDVKFKMRNHSHLVSGTNWKWVSKTESGRREILDFIFKKHDKMWFACIAESGQKQLLYRTPINHPDNNISRIRFEEHEMEIESKHIMWINIAQAMCQVFSKTELKSGDLNPSRISIYKNMEPQWENHLRFLKFYYHSAIWQLSVFLSYKEDKDESRDERVISRNSGTENRIGSTNERKHSTGNEQLDFFAS